MDRYVHLIDGCEAPFSYLISRMRETIFLFDLLSPLCLGLGSSLWCCTYTTKFACICISLYVWSCVSMYVYTRKR
ncbi:hypothetical protein CSUI_007672 [Cystoisospora suis]|uniref:Transmembrane protein n=1 Tax=Cystoisospora suis TaxID=483139 RepID=A0A2C6KPG8_9APIC|nr:hypothetical protein CSUI_007672 [Cystoisospora suis]